jgi:hypothetical protein
VTDHGSRGDAKTGNSCSRVNSTLFEGFLARPPVNEGFHRHCTYDTFGNAAKTKALKVIIEA